MRAANPFTFGDIAHDESFTDRRDTIRELAADMFNGQNVVLYAPRRYGKTSLVLRAMQEAQRNKALVGYCDLMMTPSKERFAGALAKTIYSDLASPVGQAFERASDLFRGLRIRPTMEFDPADGSLRFSFSSGKRRGDIDDTIERLLELLAEIAADRKRRVVIVFDEFQEIIGLDPRFPNLMRAIFQTQAEVSHVYLGSKRHVLERIFNDKNEPFWRSAKQMEIGRIPAEEFAPFIVERFAATGKSISPAAVARLLDLSLGHPYGTQELAYHLWALLPDGAMGDLDELGAALDEVLLTEHNHFAQIWDEASGPQRRLMLALSAEPTDGPYSADYHERHDLPSVAGVQRALDGLIRKEIAGRDRDGEISIIEPFLAEWLIRGEVS